MIEIANVNLELDAGLPSGQALLRAEAAALLGVNPSAIQDVSWCKRSVDARKKHEVHFTATLGVTLCDASGENELVAKALKRGVQAKVPVPFRSSQRIVPASLLANKPLRPLVVGSGPAGLFCALRLARAGLRPILIERGDAVDERILAVESFNAGGPLDTESNIQFGEGGAGTFSDGKLTTNIKSPYKQEVLQGFVQAGAPHDILWQAKPHIGTDVLVDVVRALRKMIEGAGGSVLFRTRLVSLCAQGDGLREAVLETEAKSAGRRLMDYGCSRLASHYILPCDTVVLACGHSARDTFQMLYEKGFALERKPFSVGVRIEHTQSAIDKAQYGPSEGHPALGPADYKLSATTSKGRGVYTFCMCPGGEVVAAASESGGVCVNGMSKRARKGRNANAAVLVSVEPKDLAGTHPLAGVAFQRDMEHRAFELAQRMGGKAYAAPCERVGDFLRRSRSGVGKDEREAAPDTPSASCKPVSTYPRETVFCDLRECLPAFVADALAEAIELFARRISCFDDADALLTGVETRSSSPVRIVRGKADFQTLTMKGVYPCGEGAGYAGGIMSAACDGLRVADALIDKALRAHGSACEAVVSHG